MSKNRRTLTGEEKAAQLRLKSAWAAKARALGLTQERAGAKIGITQGGVTQYLNGLIPLNLTMLLKFCSLLGEEPESIFPEIMCNALMKPVASDEFSELFSTLSDDDKQYILSLMTRLSSGG